MKFKKLKEKLKESKRFVWPIIQNYLPEQYPKKHYEMISDYPKRQGKYFRASLVLLGNELFRGKKEDSFLCAAAMQLSEDWLLIHDDFEDHSDERRHKKSLNKIWGDELAVNAGDSLHLIMWQVIGEAVKNFSGKNPWQLYDSLNKSLRITTEGQFLELNWIKENKIDINEKEYYEMIDRKTAHYTIITPLTLGAITSKNANEEDLEKIKDWGIPFGRAFQIWDDIMNIESKTEDQGKENGGDILEGKRTLLLIHLLKHCSPTEKIEIKKVYKKKRENKSLKEKEYIQNLFYKYKSINFAKEKATEFSNEAKNIFKKYYKNNKTEAKEIIHSTIEFVIDRKS